MPNKLILRRPFLHMVLVVLVLGCTCVDLFTEAYQYHHHQAHHDGAALFPGLDPRLQRSDARSSRHSRALQAISIGDGGGGDIIGSAVTGGNNDESKATVDKSTTSDESKPTVDKIKFIDTNNTKLDYSILVTKNYFRECNDQTHELYENYTDIKILVDGFANSPLNTSATKPPDLNLTFDETLRNEMLSACESRTDGNGMSAFTGELNCTYTMSNSSTTEQGKETNFTVNTYIKNYGNCIANTTECKKIDDKFLGLVMSSMGSQCGDFSIDDPVLQKRAGAGRFFSFRDSSSWMVTVGASTVAAAWLGGML